ncbi:hypothetical protein LCGC14_0984500 [marine sediment metagenome]|uniref:Uncharacterized protein n=1 Tax=marine sediment metagenome TaxID=412755 RepID=A0A0F9N7M5_9ZZZZ
MSDQMSGLFQLDEDTLNAGGFACDVINMALHWGVLVPDTRLQAIADAWGATSDRDRGRLRGWSPHLVGAIEDALVEGEQP